MEHEALGQGGGSLHAIGQADGTVVVQVSQGVITLTKEDAAALGEALQQKGDEPAAAEGEAEPDATSTEPAATDAAAESAEA
jgi:hypothetical protein